jgi:serine/threonine protein phosphatase PrpC
MNCPLCNAINRDDAKFCKVCGKPLSPKPEPAMVNSEGAKELERGAKNLKDAPQAAHPALHHPPITSPPERVARDDEAPPMAPTEIETDEAGDPSLAPTLILTPEQMLAYHARRLREAKQGQDGTELEAQSTSVTPGDKDISDIGEMPGLEAPQDVPMNWHSTVLPHKEMPLPSPPEATPIQSTTENEQPQDIVDLPGHPSPGPEAPQASLPHEETPLQDTTSNSEDQPVDIPPPPPPPSSQGDHEGHSYAEEGKEDGGLMAGETAKAEDTAQEESEGMQAAQPQPDESEQAEQAEQAAGRPQGSPLPGEQTATAGDFAVLPVGTTVVGRYEITQVLSDNPQEHIYQVIDHQGYQRCWSCGSEQNAEGSEFCDSCGAGLLDISYVMHEYSAAESQEGDARVQGTIVNTFIDQGRTYVIELPQVLENVFPTGVHLLAACDSDAGTVRRSEPNEDSTLVLQFQRVFESISEPLGVFIVADGLGGHDNGQVASRMAINIIAERLVRELLVDPLTSEKEGEARKVYDEDGLAEMLRGAVEEANARLCQVNQQDKTDMGSTLTGFMVVGDHAYIVNVGDSRTYILRSKQLYQVTTDHSLVGQLVAGGLISPEDVYTHPQRSQIFRSLGDKLHVSIDIFKQQLHPGDVLLSCSDGLWEMVRNPQIESILNNAADPQIACTDLIEAANTNGGEDNVSAVVVFVR